MPAVRVERSQLDFFSHEINRIYEVLSTAPCDLARLMSCTHEEADTSLYVHASDGDEHGMNKILPRTVDT